MIWGDFPHHFSETSKYAALGGRFFIRHPDTPKTPCCPRYFSRIIGPSIHGPWDWETTVGDLVPIWEVNLWDLHSLVQVREKMTLVFDTKHIEKQIISEKNISVFKEKKCVSWWKIVMLKNEQVRNAYEEQGGKTTSVDDHKASSLNTTWHDDRNAKHVLAKIHVISNSNFLWVSAHLEVSQTRIHNFPMPCHKRSRESSRFSRGAWLWKVASKRDELFNKISTKIDDWDWFLRSLAEGTRNAKPSFPTCWVCHLPIEIKKQSAFQWMKRSEELMTCRRRVGVVTVRDWNLDIAAGPKSQFWQLRTRQFYYEGLKLSLLYVSYP